MPPMTDNQRESAIRERAKVLRRTRPNLTEKVVRQLAEDHVANSAHLRGRYR